MWLVLNHDAKVLKYISEYQELTVSSEMCCNSSELSQNTNSLCLVLLKVAIVLEYILEYRNVLVSSEPHCNSSEIYIRLPIAYA